MKAGWKVRPLGEVVSLNYGKAISKDLRSPTGPVPVYGANGVMDYCQTALRQGPSLIVGRKGSAGAINRVDGPFWASDVSYFTTHDARRIDFDFLEYLLVQLDLPALAKGVKPGINRDEVYEIIINLPPLDEQKRIVAVLDEAFESLARARANAEANHADARELFAAVLKRQSSPNHPMAGARLPLRDWKNGHRLDAANL
ncbi:MAG: restriction endonuclease subunit S [Alphaproteobacteria bacterium]